MHVCQFFKDDIAQVPGFRQPYCKAVGCLSQFLNIDQHEPTSNTYSSPLATRKLPSRKQRRHNTHMIYMFLDAHFYAYIYIILYQKKCFVYTSADYSLISRFGSPCRPGPCQWHHRGKARLFEFIAALTDQPVPNSQARAVHSSGGAAGGVVSESQGRLGGAAGAGPWGWDRGRCQLRWLIYQPFNSGS